MKLMKQITAGGFARLLAVAVLAGAVIALGQDTQRPQDPAPAPDPAETFEARYAVLTRNNIFVRDRRPAPPSSEGPTTREAPAAPPAPEKDWVLIGVVFEEGRFRAYFENLRGDPTTRAVVGDPIADGVIDEVFLDAIAYQANGERIWVDIGQDLTGAPPGGPSSTASADDSDDSDDDAIDGERSPIDVNADPSTLSIEEQMRIRRQQESGGP